MKSVESFKGMRVALNAAFLEIFREQPDVWFSSSCIAKLMAHESSSTDKKGRNSKGNKNWLWYAFMEDLCADGMLKKYNELCKQKYNDKGIALPRKTRRCWYKLKVPGDE